MNTAGTALGGGGGGGNPADPCGDDVQLALYTCYELPYRGFDAVDRDGSGIPRSPRPAPRRKTASSPLCGTTRTPGGR